MAYYSVQLYFLILSCLLMLQHKCGCVICLSYNPQNYPSRGKKISTGGILVPLCNICEGKWGEWKRISISFNNVYPFPLTNAAYPTEFLLQFVFCSRFQISKAFMTGLPPDIHLDTSYACLKLALRTLLPVPAHLSTRPPSVIYILFLLPHWLDEMVFILVLSAVYYILTLR